MQQTRGMNTSTTMKAIRIHEFGSPDRMQIEEVPVPTPAPDQILVHIEASGVGPWDAWIREGKSVLPQPLPLTLGAEFSGTIESRGSEIKHLKIGDPVYGVLNSNFTGGYAQYALTSPQLISLKPRHLSFVEAASAPVVAVTANQMLFKEAQISPGQRLLILGAAGNVGRYAIQLAHSHGSTVIAAVASNDSTELKNLGAREIINTKTVSLEKAFEKNEKVDGVIDLVGGDLQSRSFQVIKPGGFLISAVSNPSPELAMKFKILARFMLVQVNHDSLNKIRELFDSHQLKANVGTVLPLEEAQKAHEMLGGKISHPPGKIVLKI